MKPITLFTQAAATVAAGALCAAAAAQAGRDPSPSFDVRTLVSNPAHRAMFCGAEGTETSAAYATTVNRAITVLIERRLAKDAADAVAALKQGLCTGPGASPRPVS